MTNTITKKTANSIVGKLTAVILAGAAAVAPGSAPAAPAQVAAANVLVIGDSLQVGTGPYLEQQLGPVPVEFDQEQSRGSAVGLSILRERLRPEQNVVIFDMGTNDDPGNPDALIATMSAARQAAGERCLIIATILRPPSNGVSVAGMNVALERFAVATPNVVLVDWQGIATSTPGILYDDGVHARPEGYRLRGRLLAEAVASCGAGGGGVALDSGIPAPKDDGVELPAPMPAPEPEEVEVEVATPATLAAVGATLRHTLELISRAAQDGRRAAGLGPPEPVLGGR